MTGEVVLEWHAHQWARQGDSLVCPCRDRIYLGVGWAGGPAGKWVAKLK